MWGAIAGAALGAMAGGQKDQSSATSSLNIAPESALEAQASGSIAANFGQLQNFINAGPGMSAVNASQVSNAGLADMLKKYSQGGFLPSEADMATANKFAQSAYNPQAVALQQQFGQQQQRAAQLASQLGRPVNDPIIQAKLSQEYMQGQERLGAAQGAFANQFALNLPQQRLGYTAQLADVQNSLASQAMANRQALLSLGSQIQGAERNWRLNTASRTQSQESGGGFKGMLTGALGGAAGFMGLSNLASQGALAQAQTGFYQQAPQAMVQAAAAGRPITNNFAAAPQAVPELAGPPAPAQSSWAPMPVFNSFGQANQFVGPSYATQQELGTNAFNITPNYQQPAFMPYRGY